MAVGKSLELAGCTLDLQVLSDVQITNGTRLVMVDVYSAAPTVGTFDGLPEGTRFLADGYAFTITYQGGAHSNSVVLTVNAPFIWDGGGSGNLWGTASNWVGDVAPISGSDLVFPDGVSKLGMINAFDPGSSFRSLTFTGPSYLLVGNSFGLTEGIYNDAVSGDTTITADITLTPVPFSGEITCRVSSASRLSLEGGVTANAGWRKTRTGTLRLAGTAPNSLATMLVWEGELELDKTPGVNAISGGFGALSIGDGTNEARVILLGDEQIADDKLVILRGPARLDLNGHDESIGRLEGDGTVVLNSRLIPGDLNRSSRLTVTQGTFAGTITGQGGLTKTGVWAALWLTGHNTYSGPTVLNGGTLVVDGVQTNSPIRLDGGLLCGLGRVGTLTGNLGGTVQPGVTALVFENRFFCQDVAFTSTTTFRPLLTSQDPGFENSQLQVTGTVDLGGSTLGVELFQNFKPTNGLSFLIIDNDGADPVVGTFAGLPEGAVFGGGGLPFRISYVGGTGNDVVITRVAAPASTLSSITALGNGQMRVEGLGIGGVIYPIQAATNLNPIIFWTNVGDATANVNGLFQFIHTGAPNQPMRFYRAVSP
jgi:autotransporter-associated beta strand protein